MGPLSLSLSLPLPLPLSLAHPSLIDLLCVLCISLSHVSLFISLVCVYVLVCVCVCVCACVRSGLRTHPFSRHASVSSDYTNPKSPYLCLSPSHTRAHPQTHTHTHTHAHAHAHTHTNTHTHTHTHTLTHFSGNPKILQPSQLTCGHVQGYRIRTQIACTWIPTLRLY